MIKTLAAHIKEYKRISLLSPIFVCIEVVMEVAIPFLMSLLIDYGVDKGNMKAVVIIGIIMLIAAFISLVSGALAGKYAAIASCGFAKNLRQAEYESIQKFAFSNIDKFSTAGLVTRLTSDVTNVQNAYQMILRICFRAPLMLISAMVMVFSIHAKLASVFLAAIVFLGIVLAFIMTHAHPYFKQVFNRYDDLNASVQENISGIRVVKSYVREKYEIKKFKKASDVIYRLFMKAENLLIFNSPAMQLSMYGCIILISWIGAKMIVGGSLTTGALMSMFTYTSNILMSLMMISMIFVMLTMSLASCERICEVLNEKSSLTSPKDGVKEVKDGSIRFENVSFGYANDAENYNLSQLNLNIQSGSVVGIIGSTGSAKTSLVQLIPRLYDVDEGQLLVGGVNVKDYDLDALRNQVAMVLQKNVLFSGTIKENLRWGDENASDEECVKACRLAQADEFIQKMPDGYDTYIEQGGTNVSGGQRQRLCIARALLKKPKILILDDSTSAVDTKTDSLIRKAFLEEIPETTKIIIAQRISSIQDANQIIVLDDGKISAAGTHDELLKCSEIYRDIYEAQMKGGMEDE